MFCKKCGKELSGKEKFCPACGMEVSTINKKNHRNKNTEKNKKYKKYFMLAISISLLLILVIVLLTKNNNKTSSSSNYKDMPFSKKQIKELKHAYTEAYDNEKKSMDAFISYYVENYNKYASIEEMMNDLSGSGEEIYQVVNKLDPDLKDVMALDAGIQLGDSLTEMYLIEKGIGVFLSDSEVGKELRGVAFSAISGAMEYFSKRAMDDEEAEILKSDMMVYKATSEQYAVLRSYGSVDGMLEKVEHAAGYAIVDEAIKVLQEKNQQENGNLNWDDYYSEDPEVAFATSLKNEEYKGRRDALDERKSELDEELYQCQKEMLEKIGIEDVDSVLKGRMMSGEDKTEREILSYFDISKNQYEKLRKKYKTNDIWKIIRKEKGESAQDEYKKYYDKSQKNAAATREQYVYSILDKTGKVSNSFLVSNPNLEVSISNDGLCSLSVISKKTAFESDQEVKESPYMIIDKNGKILFEKDIKDKENLSMFTNMSPCGNVLKKSFFDSAEKGQYEVLELMKPDGTTKKLMEGSSIELDCNELELKDYCTYSCEGTDDSGMSGVIDLTNGTLLTREDYRKIADEKAERIEDDLGIQQAQRLNEDYVYDKEKESICDNSGKPVKALDSYNGVKKLMYGNEKYWIITESGRYYVLDQDFNEILEPVKLPEDSTWTLTEYGVVTQEVAPDESKDILNNTEYKVFLYDENGEKIELGSINDNNLTSEGFVLYSPKSLGFAPTGECFNLNTREMIFVSMPEKPIRLNLK